ncbi:hypothetical protein [Enterobacillus tribolii]|nr:hypothetical protein [Enterobacillus tribolii]
MLLTVLNNGAIKNFGAEPPVAEARAEGSYRKPCRTLLRSIHLTDEKG